MTRIELIHLYALLFIFSCLAGCAKFNSIKAMETLSEKCYMLEGKVTVDTALIKCQEGLKRNLWGEWE